MAIRLLGKLGPMLDRLSPRTRQFVTLGALCAVGVGALTLVLSLGPAQPTLPATAADKSGNLKPTNVDLMAPGSQVRDAEVWVGQAGRKLAQYESERDEQKRINRERMESESRLLARFAELEARLKAPPAAGSPVVPPTPAAAPAFPPDAGLAQAPLPPAPPPPSSLPAPPPLAPPGSARTGMPPGYPGPEVSPPVLMRVLVTPQGKAGTVAADGEAKAPPKTIDTYLPVSFTRGILLGGLDAPTGGQSQSNPHPILIRLSDNSVLPNRFRAEYRECFVIAAGYGDISSERAYLRTESLSCVRADGVAIEVRIQGSVYGEDGKVGMRGRLVTKQGQMLANALLAGIVSGIGQGVATANTSYSSSAFGQVSSVNGADALKNGIGSGVGKALDRLAQYYIKLAEQTFPVIEIDAGREIDVVITSGVRIEGAEAAKTSNTSTALQTRRTEPVDRYARGTDDED